MPAAMITAEQLQKSLPTATPKLLPIGMTLSALPLITSAPQERSWAERISLISLPVAAGMPG